ncbi:unnamed protein product [Diatraea saccharalis]|uniref:CRAL/TRIO N-terminal domain-containing protein n=1 Tax=Diatraea saccharalis TaxID=40085 RepID=A0A9P0FXL9_9NEOP|nr:unnamed protein product [Diatraea saccharalis]
MPVRPLNPELAKKAREELNEDPERLEDGLRHLKDWLAKQPHLNVNTDDQWLVIFLRGCKYSMEKAKQKLDLYYTLRSTEPYLFNTMPTIEYFNEIMDLGPVVHLPKPPGPAEPMVTIYRSGVYDPHKYDMLDMIKCSIIIQKIILYENDNAVVAGIRGIMDLENCTMAHFLQMSPTMAKKMTVYMQDAAPVRMKSHHYINTIPGFETVFNMFKALLNEKNRNRVRIHIYILMNS